MYFIKITTMKTNNKNNNFISSCKLNSDDNRNINFIDMEPIVKYDDADVDKVKIFADNRNKSGVYRWINKKTGKTYVGSSMSLTRRFTTYYSIGYLLRETKKNSSYIYRALLKYGYSNFKLEILEYCEPEKCIEREQYYINLLKASGGARSAPPDAAPPEGGAAEYNLLQVAGSRLGQNHSEETKAKFSAWERSEETRAKMSESKKGEKNPIKTHSEEVRAKISASRRANPCGSSQPTCQKIEVLDLETNITTIYNSIQEAARALNIHNYSICQYFIKSQKKPYKGRYIFTKS
uniref:GIY-YIG endonuclease n=1 Tax=Morchella brunnea TaxID=1174671 RepID=A0A8K1I5K9_9PEZI|nr:GIY-YIG endonuclease [Morchella brunnea]UBU98480.1 GIY-YIG endonuclease [Morchella brunnea]